MQRNINEEKLHLVLKEFYMFYISKIDKNYSKSDKRYITLNYTETTSVYNFSKYLKEKHSEYNNLNWIFDYFNYQFTYWDWWQTQKEKNGESVKIMANWVLGQKALKRFWSKTQKDTYFYHSSFFVKYKIQKKDLFDLLEQKNLFSDDVVEDEVKILNPLNSQEEEVKKKYLNTKNGLINCIEFTTLFKFTSPICEECIWKEKCKIILKTNFNDLYNKRLANKISSL